MPSLPVQVAIEGQDRFGSVFSGAVSGLQDIVAQTGILNPQLVTLARTAGAAGAGMAIVATAAAVGTRAMAGMADQVQEMQNALRQTGLNTRQWENLTAAFRDMGFAGDTTRMVMANLNRAIAQNDPILKALNVTSRDGYTALLQFAKGLSMINDQAVRTEAVQQIFRGAGPEMLAAFDQLATVLPRVEQLLDMTNQRLTESQIELGQKSEAILKRNAAVWAGYWHTIQVGAAQAMVAVDNFLSMVLRNDKPLGAGGTFQTDMFTVHGTKGGPTKVEKSAAEQMLENLIAALKSAKQVSNDTSQSIVEDWRTGMPVIRGFGQGPMSPVLEEIDVITERLATGGPLPQTLDEWASTWAEENANMARVSLAVTDSITFGFQNAFANMIGTTQTFASAVVGIFRGIAQAVLAEIGRIAAGWALIGLGGLVGGPVGLFLGAVGAGVAGGNAASTGRTDMARGLSRGGDTFILQGFHHKDVIQEIQSRSGLFNRANTTVLYGRTP